MIKGVITGDLVNSTNIAAEWRQAVVGALYKCAADFSPLTPINIEMYRGDSFQVVVGNLKHNRRVFGKQNLYCVIFCKSVERDVEPAFLVGKTHLKQAGNKTTGRYVMPRQHDSFFN